MTVQVRDAATIIVIRDPGGPAPAVLMGQRGDKAAFMPSMFVFPGGAVDAGDGDVPLAAPIPAGCQAQLADHAPAGLAPALAAAAIRELWEETGQLLAVPGDWPDAPPDWQGFAARGLRPTAAPLRFVFRALTPPGRPRRFDARFFLTDAANLVGDIDDFSAASDELSALQWVPLSEARQFRLPFITDVVLAEVAAALPALDPPATVPYFHNGAEENLFIRLGGKGPMTGQKH